MTDNYQVIALCSVGSLGKYLCDELLADGRYKFVVISRQSNKGAFFEQRNIDVRISDYTTDSVIRILDETNASTFISFNNSADQTFVTLHCAFLEACQKSKNCKRFIPSEFAGNIDDFPLFPSFYKTSRVPFREILRQQNDVEWTIFNNGWLMDYFLTEDKTYMPSIPGEFPIDPNNWKACIRGTGDQLQSFTSARDIAKALIMLLSASEWERTTYITGHWATFNEMARAMEKFHDRPMEKTYRSKEQIDRDVSLPPTAENLEVLYLASVEEMMITGSGACPREKTIRQRGKFFEDLSFTTLEGITDIFMPKSRDGFAARQCPGSVPGVTMPGEPQIGEPCAFVRDVSRLMWENETIEVKRHTAKDLNGHTGANANENENRVQLKSCSSLSLQKV